MDKIKKLSEAMRLGATFGHQCYGTYFSENHSSCALGAVIKATGIRGGLALIQRFPELCHYNYKIFCGFPKNGRTLREYIVYLNDTVGLSREEIAEWLESNNY